MRSTSVLLICALTLCGCVRRVVSPDVAQDTQLPEPAPGFVAVNVMSDFDGPVWDVTVGEDPPCQTPCSKLVRDADNLFLRNRRGQALVVNPLAVEAPGARRVVVVAEGTDRAKQVNGIVFTTLGAMAFVTGIPLTAVGCSNVQERAGMCTAGLIVGGVGAAMTAVFIALLVDSAPKVHVLPVATLPGPGGQPAATVALTPTGLAGTF